ncbi:hypothetical protein HYU95_01450 [Candidatus Daviesbacteria bacterium]|nr:hypothetical protein [Candidatus Daviesbacteria bacterium]
MPYILRAKVTSPQAIQELLKELEEAKGKIYANLVAQRQALTTTPETALEREILDRKIGAIVAETDATKDLILEKADIRTRRMSEREIILVDEIKELEGQLEGASEQDKERIKLEIRKRAVALQKTMTAPEDEPIPDDILKAIGRDKVATEEFVSRLIVSYQEDDPYQMRGFYGPINLDKFLKLNQDIDPDRMERLKNLIQANQAFHNMNYIIKRSFEQFIEQSRALLPRHFEVVMELPGVDAVFRAYERFTKEELGIETRVTENAFIKIEKEIMKLFKEKAEAQKLGIKGFIGGDLEEWEVNRALIYGRSLYRLSVRAAEVIAQSELHPDQEKIISPPQKELTQVMHTLKYVNFRFKPGESRGGVELIEEVRDKRKQKRREKGKVRIKTLEGTDVDMRELQEIISSRGVFATWRNAHALLSEVKFRDGGKTTDVVRFFRDHEEEIKRFKELGESDDAGWKREYRRAGGDTKDPKKKKDFAQWRKEQVGKLFKPLLEGNSIALGILVSGNGLSVPTELKELIWEKIAELNPGVMASLLTRLEIDREVKNADRIKDVKSLEEILVRHFGTEDQKKLLFEAEVSDELRKKLSPEELRNPIIALLKREDSLDQQIQIEADGQKKESLKEELQEVRNSLRWKPTVLKRKVEDLETELKKLKGKESKQRGHISNTEAKEIEDKAKELQGEKAEYDKVNEMVKELLRVPEWVKLKDKFNTANELRLKDEIERIKKMEKGEQVPNGPKKLGDYLDLNSEEKQVLEAITMNGQKIARDLANIKQVTTWFLNDTPLEIMKWTNLGQFYDRQTNDLASFSKAAAALMKVLGDPFAIPPQEVIKAVREAMGEAGNVLGLEPAQENIEPILTQYFEMIYESPDNFWGRQIIWSSIEHGRHKPTSRAQEVTGSVDAPSVNEDTMFQLTQEALHAGAYRKEVRDKKTGQLKFKSTMEEAEKKLGIAWFKRFILANARDFGPFLLIALIIKFFQGVYSPRKS